VNATNGKYFPLCENDFGKELSKFGKDLLTRIDYPKIPLKTRPVTETIKVFYKDKELPGGPLENGGYWMYNYEINAIIFHNLKFAASDNEKVTIEYLEST
jgi:hypothetical protein